MYSGWVFTGRVSEVIIIINAICLDKDLGPSFIKGTNHGLIFMRGMGAHVKNTVSSKKDFRPHTSDKAPINGALRKDSRP